MICGSKVRWACYGMGANWTGLIRKMCSTAAMHVCVTRKKRGWDQGRPYSDDIIDGEIRIYGPVHVTCVDAYTGLVLRTVAKDYVPWHAGRRTASVGTVRSGFRRRVYQRRPPARPGQGVACRAGRRRQNGQRQQALAKNSRSQPIPMLRPTSSSEPARIP